MVPSGLQFNRWLGVLIGILIRALISVLIRVLIRALVGVLISVLPLRSSCLHLDAIHAAPLRNIPIPAVVAELQRRLCAAALFRCEDVGRLQYQGNLRGQCHG